MKRALVVLASILVIAWTLKVAPLAPGCGSSEGGASEEWRIDTVARHLQVPWAIAPAGDGKVFFTERVGRLSVLDSTGAEPRGLAEFPVATSSYVHFATGLLGLAVDPEYPRLPYLYVYYTYQQGSDLLNRLVRLRLTDSAAVVDRVLLDRIPGSTFQNGGASNSAPTAACTSRPGAAPAARSCCRESRIP